MASSSEVEADYRRMTIAEYLIGEETNRPQELAYGVLREPPTPTFEHQMMVGALYRRLDRHVRRHRLGRVVLSPMDVILDVERALVVQPRSPVTGQPAPRSHRQGGVVWRVRRARVLARRSHCPSD
jgi:hypothetical protein